MQRVIELNKPAKNVIFIMGDGMGVSTTSAARVYMAQSRNLTGEDSQLSWERMPHSALSKVTLQLVLVSFVCKVTSAREGMFLQVCFYCATIA